MGAKEDHPHQLGVGERGGKHGLLLLLHGGLCCCMVHGAAWCMVHGAWCCCCCMVASAAPAAAWWPVDLGRRLLAEGCRVQHTFPTPPPLSARQPPRRLRSRDSQRTAGVQLLHPAPMLPRSLLKPPACYAAWTQQQPSCVDSVRPSCVDPVLGMLSREPSSGTFAGALCPPAGTGLRVPACLPACQQPSTAQDNSGSPTRACLPSHMPCQKRHLHAHLQGLHMFLSPLLSAGQLALRTLSVPLALLQVLE